MSGLSMRTRIITVAVSGAIVAPFALMGGSAHAVDAPIVGDVTNVDGLLGGDLLGGVLGTATGAAGATGVDPVSTVTDAAADPLAVTETLPLGDVLGGDVLETVTNLVDLENVLETVTNLVDIDGIIKTVTDLVGSVTDTLNLDDLLSLPVKVNKPAGEVKGAAKPAAAKKAAKETVSAGSLPQTGGNADLTAMLLCAGLAVAGTGVTLVTRRRNSILGAA